VQRHDTLVLRLRKQQRETSAQQLFLSIAMDLAKRWIDAAKDAVVVDDCHADGRTLNDLIHQPQCMVRSLNALRSGR
jgi:orotate phosphoribosyltransferase-like protein